MRRACISIVVAPADNLHADQSAADAVLKNSPGVALVADSAAAGGVPFVHRSGSLQVLYNTQCAQSIMVHAKLALQKFACRNFQQLFSGKELQFKPLLLSGYFTFYFMYLLKNMLKMSVFVCSC